MQVHIYKWLIKMKGKKKKERTCFSASNSMAFSIPEREICQSRGSSRELKFIRLDFTDLRHQWADSIRDRLDLSDRAFHIRAFDDGRCDDRSICPTNLMGNCLYVVRVSPRRLERNFSWSRALCSPLSRAASGKTYFADLLNRDFGSE